MEVSVFQLLKNQSKQVQFYKVADRFVLNISFAC